MLVDLEYLFLRAKITILDYRNRLSIYIIEALEYLKSQLKIKAFKEEDNVNKGYKDIYINDIR